MPSARERSSVRLWRLFLAAGTAVLKLLSRRQPTTRGLAAQLLRLGVAPPALGISLPYGQRRGRRSTGLVRSVGAMRVRLLAPRNQSTKQTRRIKRTSSNRLRILPAHARPAPRESNPNRTSNPKTNPKRRVKP
jgi:hypothetical protein